MRKGFFLPRETSHNGSGTVQDSMEPQRQEAYSLFDSDNTGFTFGSVPVAPAAPRRQPGSQQTIFSTARENVTSAVVDAAIPDAAMMIVDAVQAAPSQMPDVHMVPARLPKDRKVRQSSAPNLSAAFRTEHENSSCINGCCKEESRIVSTPASSSKEQCEVEMIPSSVDAGAFPSKKLQALYEEIDIRDRLHVLNRGRQVLIPSDDASYGEDINGGHTCQGRPCDVDELHPTWGQCICANRYRFAQKGPGSWGTCDIGGGLFRCGGVCVSFASRCMDAACICGFNSETVRRTLTLQNLGTFFAMRR